MAAVGLPIPGSEYGPCEGECLHVDCAETRRQAATACSFCGKPIGYDNRFFQRDNWQTLTHMLCRMKEVGRT